MITRVNPVVVLSLYGNIPMYLYMLDEDGFEIAKNHLPEEILVKDPLGFYCCVLHPKYHVADVINALDASGMDVQIVYSRN